MIIKIQQLDALVAESVKTKQLSNVTVQYGIKENVTNPIVTIYTDGYTMIDETLFFSRITNGRLILTVVLFLGNDSKNPTDEQFDRIKEINSILDKHGVIWNLMKQ